MDKQMKATEFAVFCIENTAARLQESGQKVFMELMKTNGIENFLYPSYHALHTQSKDYIVDEILKYMRQHTPTTNHKSVAQ